LRTPEHRLGKIDTGQPRPPVEHGQFEAGADANIKNMSAPTADGRSGSFASGPQDEREDEIVNRRPARVGFLDMFIIENGGITGLPWPSVHGSGIAGKDFLLHGREPPRFDAATSILMDPRSSQLFYASAYARERPVLLSKGQWLGAYVTIFPSRRTSRFRRNNEAAAQNPCARPVRRIKDAGLARRNAIFGRGEFDGGFFGTNEKETLNRRPGRADLHEDFLSFGMIL
jgi:hypothetical protein